MLPQAACHVKPVVKQSNSSAHTPPSCLKTLPQKHSAARTKQIMHLIVKNADSRLIRIDYCIYASDCNIRERRAGHRSDPAGLQQAQAWSGAQVLPASQAHRCQGEICHNALFFIIHATLRITLSRLLSSCLAADACNMPRRSVFRFSTVPLQVLALRAVLAF